MAKVDKTRNSRTSKTKAESLVISNGSRLENDRAVTIMFGDVTIQSERRPSRSILLTNTKLGNSAFKRAAPTLIKPGVRLKIGNDIAAYFADPEDPTRLVRKLNGKYVRGRLKDGKFLKVE